MSAPLLRQDKESAARPVYAPSLTGESLPQAEKLRKVVRRGPSASLRIHSDTFLLFPPSACAQDRQHIGHCHLCPSLYDIL
jgi:hypothetical protein